MKLWTFVISSGPQIKVALPDNPPLDYPGRGQVIWKILVTEETAKTYAESLTNLGLEIATYTEEMTEEMRKEKAELQGPPPDSQ